jgi:hypothetical protein
VTVINPQSGKSEQRVFVPEVVNTDGSIDGKLWGGSKAEDRETLDEDTVHEDENRLDEAVAQARKHAGVPMGSLGLSLADADAEAAKADDEDSDPGADPAQAVQHGPMVVDDDQEDEEDAEYKKYLATLEGATDKDAAVRPGKRRRQRFEQPGHSPFVALAGDFETPKKSGRGRDASTPATPLPSQNASGSSTPIVSSGPAVKGEGPVLLEHKLEPLSSSTSLCEEWTKLLRGPVGDLKMDSGLLSRVRVALEPALVWIKALADGAIVKELPVKAKVEVVVLRVLCRVATCTLKTDESL